MGMRVTRAEFMGIDCMDEGELRDLALDLLAKNAELREKAERARDPQRIGGQADPSSFVYAIEQLREFRWQHATNDEDAIPYINNVAAAHERENAKLRELVKYTLLCCEKGWPCEECPLCGEQGTSSDVDGREIAYTICNARDMAQELGIEVDA